MRKIFLLLVVLNSFVFAQTFNFNSQGEKAANDIMKTFINTEYNMEDIETIAYQYDSKIIGIVKHNIFYTLEGYKLIILQKEQDGYKPLKSNIYFDNTKEISIDNNKITYYKSVFYKNKKCTVNLKENGARTNKSLNDVLTDNKMRKIEKLVHHTKNKNINNLELADFKTSTERKVNIKYKNLNEKTKHYIEMR